jgi:hypothetical protein
MSDIAARVRRLEARLGGISSQEIRVAQCVHADTGEFPEGTRPEVVNAVLALEAALAMMRESIPDAPDEVI